MLNQTKNPISACVCSYCSKIIKDPITLPCNHSICGEHLIDRDVVNPNKIKCKNCNQEYPVKGNAFESNNVLTKLIESQSYLSEEEKSLKQEFEASVRKFFQFYDDFIQNKTQLESDVFEHFQEMRFQIDQQREELKKKIDDIALAMIDETKKYEAIYLKSLKEKLLENFSSLFDESQSLDNELNQIEETFRNPNLLIKTIKKMQQKQAESLNEIQFKLNEMNQVRDDLKASNYFMPNLSSFNQMETFLFGSIK